jgi:hypothetical protein
MVTFGNYTEVMKQKILAAIVEQDTVVAMSAKKLRLQLMFTTEDLQSIGDSLFPQKGYHYQSFTSFESNSNLFTEFLENCIKKTETYKGLVKVGSGKYAPTIIRASFSQALQAHEFIDGMNTKKLQLQSFLNIAPQSHFMGDILMACMRRDLLVLTATRYSDFVAVIRGNHDRRHLSLEYMNGDVAHAVKEFTSVSDIRHNNPGLAFLIRRYNINLYYARQYWLFRNSAKYNDNSNTETNANLPLKWGPGPNLYEVDKIIAMLHGRSKWLQADKNQNYTLGGVPTRDEETKPMHADDGSMMHALRLESELALQSNSPSLGEQFDYSVLSAKALGCIEAVPTEEITAIESMFMSSSL